MQQFNLPNNPNLRLNGRCPVCQTMYSFQNLRVLGEKDQQVLTYIQCSHCSSGVVSVLSLNPFGLKASGVITDLNADEILELEGADNITDDEVMDIHEVLEDPDTINKLINKHIK
ncbi:MAG: hypothetical protein V1838_02735 [Patescibacteria group bacterium]